ncbi:MAG: hypothetical protein KME13_14930 [Myxacorys californica WJT36-NPBG1]|jgi:hypothetical protein|nr:hypothetical protein [Myxacorys californica WJT36-NPBG1]
MNQALKPFTLIITTGLIVVLAGCGSSRTTPSASVQPSATPSPSAPEQNSVSTTSVQPSATLSPSSLKQNSVSAAKTISAEGIGSARLGMTLGELKQKLGASSTFKVESPFMVDFDAIAVSQSGEVQYRILYPAGIKLEDSDVITALVTDNSSYRTAQGVGAGTSIQQAEAIYGDATLSYNTSNESREYVNFTAQPAPNISFRTAAKGGFSGIYPSPAGENNTTKQFQDNASVGSVEVTCSPQSCSKP